MVFCGGGEMKILRTNQTIKVKIEDLTFSFRPLTYQRKIEIHSLSGGKDFSITQRALEATRLALKYSLVNISGLEDYYGQPLTVEMDENGFVKDEFIDDLFNLPINAELTTTVVSLLNNIPKEICDPTTGQVLKNVVILNPKKKLTNN